MQTRFVTTQDGTLLEGVRASIRGADRVLICSAFVAEAGLRLLQKELQEVTARKRPVGLLVTSVFGSTRPSALDEAEALGAEVRVFNQPRGTFHPKVYLGLTDKRCRAVIGSANLTGGLAANVEAGTWFEGTLRDQPLRAAWEWAETLWGDPIVEYWEPSATPRADVETLDPELRILLERAAAENPVFRTLGRSPRPNRIMAIRPGAVVVVAKNLEGDPQPVPAWMLNLAWQYLRTHGVLTNKYLLETLRVHRSSAVCAILARLPPVEVVAGPLVTLRWRGPSGRRR